MPWMRPGGAEAVIAPLTPTRSKRQEQYPDQGNPFADELEQIAAATGKEEEDEEDEVTAVSPLLPSDVVAPSPLDLTGNVRVWEQLGMHRVEGKEGVVGVPRPRSGVFELHGGGDDERPGRAM